MNRSRKFLLSTLEFAEYAGISVRTVKRCISNGAIAVTKIKAEKGCRRNHLENRIHYSALSVEAQQRFLQDRNLIKPTETEPAKNSRFTPKQEDRQTRKEEATRELLAALEAVPHGKKRAIKEGIAKLYDLSRRTLERAVRDFSEGGSDALIPAWNCGKRHNPMEQEVDRLIDSIFMQPFGPSVKELHELISEKFGEGTIRYRALANRINSRYPKGQQLLVRNKEEWDKRYSPHVRRKWSKCGLNEVWFGDAKQVDVACFFRDKPVFPWFTAFLDARSRKFVGWIVTPTPDSWAIAQAFDYAISKHGVPQTIYIDRGKSYRSNLIAGSKVRSGREIEPFTDFAETMIPGIFRELGSEIFYASPYNAREKIIEPNFKIFTQRFRHLPGYRSPSAKTRPKKCERDIKAGKILPIEQLSSEVDDLIIKRNARPHSTTGKSPDSYYEGFTPAVPSKEMRAYLRMDVCHKRVKDATVTVGGMTYRNDNLWRLAGETVMVRRDPNDLREAVIIYQDKLFGFARLEMASHYRDPITLESVRTARRIRQRISRWRKAVIENEGAIEDPLQFAVELDETEKLRSREIRPAASKVVSFHVKEKLARAVAQGLKDRPSEEPEQEGVNQESSIVGRLLNAAKASERKKAPIRVLEHLSLDDPWDEREDN